MKQAVKSPLVWVLGFLFTVTGASLAGSFADMEKAFVDVPASSRELTGPLFWLHGDESEELLRRYVRITAEGGNGTLTAESRPHKDWLGEGWYRDLAIVLDEVKKQGMTMWIFDEKWWPSGEVGGMVPQQYGSKNMMAMGIVLDGPTQYTYTFKTDKRIAVLAGKVMADGIDGDSLIDLTGSINDDTVMFNAPEGQWKLMVFTWEYSAGRGGHFLVDGASQDAVDWYIKTVYQPHYDRFKDDFGKTIKGFFYDEPEMYGDWGTEVIPLMKERGVDWKKALVAWKFRLADGEQQAGRYQYHDAFAEAWGRTLFGGITEWCHAHGVKSIGHFLEHSHEYYGMHQAAGDMFAQQKYSDMGGIDAVFSQFIMGRRVAYDSATWSTPKLASSISHVYGKDDDLAMVEIFGARGQDLTYPEMKWWTDHMQVCGINFHIPHSFNPKSPNDTDCPPYFYNNGNEPRWPLYKVYADYTTRLSGVLSGGKHVCPVALLYFGASVHVGQTTALEPMNDALQDALFDCDWMPYEVFEGKVAIQDKQLSLYDEQYKVLVVPGVEVIPYATMKKAKEFFDQGGIVIGYGILPSKAAELDGDDKAICALRDAIWGKNAKPSLERCGMSNRDGQSYFMDGNPTREQIQAVMATANVKPTLEVVKGETDGWVHVLHREKDGADIFFVTNQNADTLKRDFTFRITADGYPERWDAMRGEVTALPYKRNGKTVDMSLTLASNESTLIVFNNKKRKLPDWLDENTASADNLTVQGKWSPSGKSALGPKSKETLVEEGLETCQWVWYPGIDAANEAEPGMCYFRIKQNEKEAHVGPMANTAKGILSARLVATADNQMKVYVNGKEYGAGRNEMNIWQKWIDLDITEAMTKSKNVVAISVLNGTNEANPAGLAGVLQINYKNGLTVTHKLHGVASLDYADGWTEVDFDDSNWKRTAAVAEYGQQPWGRLGGGNKTFSPLKMPYNYNATVIVPKKLVDGTHRFVLWMSEPKPEAAVRVTVNGKDGGGFIGAPYKVDITELIKGGENTINMTPFGTSNPKDESFTKLEAELRVY